MTTVANIFELPKSEFNEKIRPHLEVAFKLTDEERRQDIKELVEEGGLDELLNCSPEELKTLGEKLEVHYLYQEPQMQDLVVAIFRYLLDNLEKPQIKEILSKVMDERQMAILSKEEVEFSDEAFRAVYHEYLAEKRRARGLSA